MLGTLAQGQIVVYPGAVHNAMGSTELEGTYDHPSTHPPMYPAMVHPSIQPWSTRPGHINKPWPATDPCSFTDKCGKTDDLGMSVRWWDIGKTVRLWTTLVGTHGV